MKIRVVKLQMIGDESVKVTFEKGKIFDRNHATFEIQFSIQEWKDWFGNAPVNTVFQMEALTLEEGFISNEDVRV